MKGQAESSKEECMMASPGWPAPKKGGAHPQHALYSTLARVNGEVNALPLEEVKKKLTERGLSSM